MISRVRTVDKVVMECTNEECAYVGQTRFVRWLNASYEEPGEWMDEPECEECGEELAEVNYPHYRYPMNFDSDKQLEND